MTYPIFFNNEYVKVNNININLYADDTSITIFAENYTLLIYYLQYYMDKKMVNNGLI